MVERSFLFLLASRVARSIALVYVSLSIPLYLSLLGLSAVNVGLVVFGVVSFYSLLSLGLGLLGDRYGYKKSLIIGDFLPLVGITALSITSNIQYVIPLLIITGIGGGAAGGLRGMWSPGISALVASNWKQEKERVKKLGYLSSGASSASIIGSLLLSIQPLLHQQPVDEYRALFRVAAVLMAISVISIFFVEEAKRPKKTTKVMGKKSFTYLIRVIASNTITGAGIGLAVPLLPLWFKLAYHATESEIGIVFTLSYLLTSVGSFLASRIRGNTLFIASLTRLLNGVFLIAMALSPFFVLSAAFYAIRGFNAGIGAPNRTAINVRGISAEDYGAATSIQGVSTRLAQLSSGASGYLMELWLPMPEILGGVLQIAGGYIYYALLSKVKSE
ncbi:MFS transporter [Stygiolobus caldivivus]|uniref:MFS transporter n=1 Tax=Stygiolobus caldivivus TaxID=2824673 RepID=A0A8D5U3Z0_9CREN|nr:MFS transporter [Stygiolobus caldivivus]BCU68951.1 MFS transporter [Stygiolobus caldivivus]